MPYSELSLELVLLQVVLPALLEQGHMRQWLKFFVRTWCIGVSYILDLRSYLLGDIDVTPNDREQVYLQLFVYWIVCSMIPLLRFGDSQTWSYSQRYTCGDDITVICLIVYFYHTWQFYWCIKALLLHLFFRAVCYSVIFERVVKISLLQH